MSHLAENGRFRGPFPGVGEWEQDATQLAGQGWSKHLSKAPELVQSGFLSTSRNRVVPLVEILVGLFPDGPSLRPRHSLLWSLSSLLQLASV